MSLFELDPAPVRQPRQPIALSDINHLLTAQILIAWAGEGGEDRRLGWWRSDLISEFGGEDLFKRLLPHTWQWAPLQGAREAARRKDAELRAQDHDPDRILSLFSLGFELDERVEERLLDLKRAGVPPVEAAGRSAAPEPAWLYQETGLPDSVLRRGGVGARAPRHHQRRPRGDQ